MAALADQMMGRANPGAQQDEPQQKPNEPKRISTTADGKKQLHTTFPDGSGNCFSLSLTVFIPMPASTNPSLQACSPSNALSFLFPSPTPMCPPYLCQASAKKQTPEMVEEFDARTDMLLLRKTRKATTLGKEGAWVYEVGQAPQTSFDPHADTLRASSTNPIFLRKAWLFLEYTFYCLI